MPFANNLSRCLDPLEQDNTVIAVIEMSQSSWLVAGIVPGIARQPLKKLQPDKAALLRLLQRRCGILAGLSTIHNALRRIGLRHKKSP
jgi:hypothetical protein